MERSMTVPDALGFAKAIEAIRVAPDVENFKRTGASVTFTIGDNAFIMSGDRHDDGFATVTRGDASTGLTALRLLLGATLRTAPQ